MVQFSQTAFADYARLTEAMAGQIGVVFSVWGCRGLGFRGVECMWFRVLGSRVFGLRALGFKFRVRVVLGTLTQVSMVALFGKGSR